MSDIIVDYYTAEYARAIMRIAMDDAARIVLEHLVPFYADVGYDLVPYGTGVLASIDDAFFVLTARHVVECLDTDRESTLVMAVDTDPINVDSIVCAWPSIIGGEHLDCCAIALKEPDLQARIKRTRKFVNIADGSVGVDSTFQGNTRFESYIVVGFPFDLNKTDYDNHVVQPGPMYIVSSTRSSRHDDAELILDVATSDPLPHPDGMSGSGVWLVRMSRSDSDISFAIEDLRLVAITHQFPPGSNTLRAIKLNPLAIAATALAARGR